MIKEKERVRKKSREREGQIWRDDINGKLNRQRTKSKRESGERERNGGQGKAIERIKRESKYDIFFVLFLPLEAF